MPVFWVNGGEVPGTPTTSQLAAYHAATSKSSGDQTAQEQATVAAVEAGVQAVAAGWQDSGGAGARQAAVALEVAAFVGSLEAKRVAAVNQYAKDAAGGSSKARKAQAEMHGADTSALVDLARLLFELRERLNDSPY